MYKKIIVHVNYGLGIVRDNRYSISEHIGSVSGIHTYFLNSQVRFIGNKELKEYYTSNNLLHFTEQLSFSSATIEDITKALFL